MAAPSYLTELNSAQREAVVHGEGPLLVLAGAGSGKTRVITYRIAHLVRRGVAPERLLALSFTNKAAREVAERARKLAGRGAAGALAVSTFHSLGLRILREEIRRLGYGPRFTLYSEADQRAAMREIHREMKLPLDPGDLLSLVSRWKNEGLEPADLPAAAGDALARALREAYRAYADLLRAQNAVDYDDLICLPLKVFRENPDCLRHWQRSFEYLLVDEYQDTNLVQFELLKALAGERANLCAVGDDDQAIYGWRGARVDQILRFEEHFPGARVVVLDQNYRSTQTVLEAAHGVVSKIASRRAKRLQATRGPGEPIGWIEADDARGEAEEVVAAVLAETYRRRRPWSDFAILYRTNAQARPLEQVLLAQSVPYRVVGGNRFFDNKEVREVLAYLRAMHNPRDDASLLRIANVPKRGLGPQALLRLREEAAVRGTTLRAALRGAHSLGAQARAGADGLLALLDGYGRRFRTEGLTAEGLRDFIAESGLRAQVQEGYESPRAVARRLALLDELAESVREAVPAGGRLDLGAFVEKTALDPPPDRELELEDAVTLLTLHSAKGLEFPVVFLTGLEEGLIPHVREAGEAALDPDEERRLCYVGMTRAKDKLYLSYARSRSRRGRLCGSEPSRFLRDVPTELTEKGGARSERSEEEDRAMARNFFAGIQSLLNR